MIDPKSITELKAGSNYLIVYSGADVSPTASRALAKEALAVLRSVEWGGGDICGNRICSSCGGVEPSRGEVFVKRGHAPDCALDAMIKRCEAATKDTP